MIFSFGDSDIQLLTSLNSTSFPTFFFSFTKSENSSWSCYYVHSNILLKLWQITVMAVKNKNLLPPLIFYLTISYIFPVDARYDFLKAPENSFVFTSNYKFSSIQGFILFISSFSFSHWSYTWEMESSTSLIFMSIFCLNSVNYLFLQNYFHFNWGYFS